MKKTPSLFMRNYETDRRVRDEVVPGSEWVLAGEGEATRKWDGTCCLFESGVLHKRYDRKLTKDASKTKRSKTGQKLAEFVQSDFKKEPHGWVPCQDTPDSNTGHWPGWLPVGPEPESKWHLAALKREWPVLEDGRTYELCGPHFQANPEGFPQDTFVPHGCHVLDVPILTFDGIREFLADHPMEGIVWHHPDGRRVKVKAADYGLAWPRCWADA